MFLYDILAYGNVLTGYLKEKEAIVTEMLMESEEDAEESN